MKSLVTFLTAIFFFYFFINVYAHVTDYTFSNVSGTYSEITGDTIVAEATVYDPMDGVAYPDNSIPFPFFFNGIPYTNFKISSNGFITFGDEPIAFMESSPIQFNNAYDGVIACFARELVGYRVVLASLRTGSNILSYIRPYEFVGLEVGKVITGDGINPGTTITALDQSAGTITMSGPATISTIYDEPCQIYSGSIVRGTSGSPGSRVHTIQFKNVKSKSNYLPDVNFVNFQIKLYEGSNKIELVYGTCYYEYPPAFGEVGLRGTDNSDFNNLSNATSDWASVTNPGSNNYQDLEMSDTIVPSLGRTFIFRLDTNILSVELSSFTSSVSGNDVSLYWSTNSEQNNSRFEIERSFEKGNWSKVGSIAGSGTSTDPHNYAYKDRNLATGKYSYRLKQIDYNGEFEYNNLDKEVIIGIPEKYKLSQNYPNPFNPTTKINFDLPYESKVTLNLFDMAGREISRLVDETKAAGYYTVMLDGTNLSSGIYFYSISAENGRGRNFIAARKMVLIK